MRENPDSKGSFTWDETSIPVCSGAGQMLDNSSSSSSSNVRSVYANQFSLLSFLRAYDTVGHSEREALMAPSARNVTVADR